MNSCTGSSGSSLHASVDPCRTNPCYHSLLAFCILRRCWSTKSQNISHSMDCPLAECISSQKGTLCSSDSQSVLSSWFKVGCTTLLKSAVGSVVLLSELEAGRHIRYEMCRSSSGLILQELVNGIPEDLSNSSTT